MEFFSFFVCSNDENRIGENGQRAMVIVLSLDWLDYEMWKRFFRYSLYTHTRTSANTQNDQMQNDIESNVNKMHKKHFRNQLLPNDSAIVMQTHIFKFLVLHFNLNWFFRCHDKSIKSTANTNTSIRRFASAQDKNYSDWTFVRSFFLRSTNNC